MCKRDYQYIAIGILVILAGLAYERDFYSVGAIIAAGVTAFDDIKTAYDDAD